MGRIAERGNRRRSAALRQAVGQLPAEARTAMLDAVRAEELIVGGYTDRSGRVCPMLAVHRRGARTDVGTFPKAWDAFARASRPRPASERELQVLRALLEESLPASPAGLSPPAPAPHRGATAPSG